MLFHQQGSHHTVPPGRIALGVVFQAFHARLPSRRPSGTMRVPSPAGPSKLTLMGVDPGRVDYNSFISFSDPGGNGWLIQEVKQRAPGPSSHSPPAINRLPRRL
jgi:hypothetical protein